MMRTPGTIRPLTKTRLSISMASSALVALIALALAAPALAGPPLLCHPYEIGKASSLPMGGGHWKDLRSGYDLARLEADTLAALGPQTPVLVRMETLRRAAVYTMDDEAAALRLLGAVQARAKQPGGGGAGSDALAQFDAGYLIETYKNTSWGWKDGSSVDGLDGYGMIASALAKRGADPEMEFAAAMASFQDRTRHDDPKLRKEAEQRRMMHWNAAVARAPEGSLLAQNLVAHAGMFGQEGKTLTQLRASAGVALNRR